MKITYTKEHKNHNPTYEIYDGDYELYAEKADRIESIAKTLRENGVKKFYVPQSFANNHISAVHQKEYIDFLKKRSHTLSENQVLYPSYFMMDTYTPIVQGTYSSAKKAVDVTLTGATHLLHGEKIAYALCRPPGHHAEEKSTGGYCYFNNAAIGANYLSKHGKNAILDIDFHHGNGTQHIFYDRSDVLYVSIHADPHDKFPYISGFTHEIGRGAGKGFTKNYPLPLGTTNERYLCVLKKAIKTIKAFHPDYLIVSAGFDTYIHDPIGGFSLTIPFYEMVGREIKKMDIPTLIVQEGGYNIQDLGKLAWSFLKGFK